MVKQYGFLSHGMGISYWKDLVGSLYKYTDALSDSHFRTAYRMSANAFSISYRMNFTSGGG